MFIIFHPVKIYTVVLRTRDFRKFDNVSILYADICNFTPLTVTLAPHQLVQTLNDLFGKFDDAAEVITGLQFFAMIRRAI